MANNIKGRLFRLASLLVAMALLFGAMPFGVSAAPWDRDEEEDRANWTYAYYLGQEYLANANGAAVKPDPVGYGFQGVITELTFVDDAGKSWTFVWSSEANGEWRITGKNVTEAVATAWPQVTDGGRYVGYCNGTAYTFTLSSDGSAKDWTYASGTHANWFYYIRFIRKYTVNVFYQNETGSVEYNGVTYAAQDPLVREFSFLYPNGNIIDDSEYEDGEYTDPITLLPADYLSQAMVDQGYELKYATDGEGNDVLQTGVTISLLGTNVLNVYCTLIPPKTENYNVIHKYYTNGQLDGTQSGGNVEVEEGADFANVVENIEKLPDYSEDTYEYTSYQVDPESKTIELTYIRTVDPEPPTEPTPDPVDMTVTKAWANDTPSLRPESVLVQLYRDGVAEGDPLELNDANGWSHTWTGLDGSAVWTVDELYIPRGYIKTVEQENGVVVITNTHTDKRIGDAHAAVTKIWDDNGYPDRPTSVTVQLLCEGEVYGDPVVLNADNHWHYTWYQLNPDLNWTLEEINVPDGYTATVFQDGFYFTVTNHMDYEPPIEPTEPPTEPTEPPTEPTEPPTEPTEPPTEPTEPPTEPTEPTTEPTEPPTEPTEPPRSPTEPPTEPTAPPTEPTEPTTEPTEPPRSPTEPTTEPTEPPTEATEPPVEETDLPTYPIMPLDDEGDDTATTEPPAVVDVPVTGGTLSAWIMISTVSGICLAGTLLTRKKED